MTALTSQIVPELSESELGNQHKTFKKLSVPIGAEPPPEKKKAVKVATRKSSRNKNTKKYKGEKIADILVKSSESLKPINCPTKLNSEAIDEFLLIFLVASTCKGTSIFTNLSELNKKESKRLDWGIKILRMLNISVKKIKNDGYLHNHIRMWFASIWIFTLELPWQLGANFFMENLLDGDPASNTLSWRWVSGIQTKGKHYLARKNNIIKYGNIEIDDNIKLNEQAVYLEESKNYFAKDLFFDNPKTDSLDSILIPTDDLNFILNNKFQCKNIFSGAPLNDYNDHNFSQKVKDHIKKITISNFKDNDFYNNYEYIIVFNQVSF